MLSRFKNSPLSRAAGQGGPAGGRFLAAMGKVRRGRLPVLVAGMALLAALALAGCTSGAYPVDIFYEQHYQQSYKSHEPPRLPGVDGAVAFYPAPPNTTDDSGAHLYEINCQMCHGTDGRDSGPVLQRLTSSPADGGYGYQFNIFDPTTSEPRPPNLTVLEPTVIEGYLRSEVRPFTPVSVMPPFGKLLSEDERRAIAQYVSALP